MNEKIKYMFFLNFCMYLDSEYVTVCINPIAIELEHGQKVILFSYFLMHDYSNFEFEGAPLVY
jgi:hypothetical protein